MTNTLTGMIPTIYEALNVVSREQIGFISAVRLDSKVERAALNQVVTVPLAQAGPLEDIVPGQLPANSGGTTINNVSVSLTRAKAAPILWTGEEQKAVGMTGVYNQILADQFMDGFRKITNLVESDLANAIANGASRAVGTAGTTPFGVAGDLSDFANARQVLEDNGAPLTDLQLVMSSAAIANMRGKQSVLFKVSEAGTSDLLRTGMTDRVQGMAIRTSAGIVQHVKGGGTLYVTSGSTAAGITSVALVTGSGTVLVGDVVTFAADATNKYIISTGVAAPGTIALNNPGARIVIPTGNAMTIGNSYTPSLAFARTAAVLATRAPALPIGGDMADDRMSVQDPVSGLTFEISMYRLYRQVKIEIALVWGWGIIKPEHIVAIQG